MLLAMFAEFVAVLGSFWRQTAGLSVAVAAEESLKVAFEDSDIAVVGRRPAARQNEVDSWRFFWRKKFVFASGEAQ